MNTIAIIQARMGSSRLPGKVMMTIDHKPLIRHMINRVKSSPFVDKIVIATDYNSYEIMDFVRTYNSHNIMNIGLYVGDEEDVLSRFYGAALSYNADVIVDLTADCPLVDPMHINRLIEYVVIDDHDYASNINPRCWPDGFDVQVYKRPVLFYLHRNVSGKMREHTGYNAIVSDQINTMACLRPDDEKYNLPNMRLTVDHVEDFLTVEPMIKKISQESGEWWPAEKIIDYYLENPKLILNKHLEK